MSDESRIVYTPRSDVTSEQARDVRARAWRYIFDCYANKKAGATHAGDEAKGPNEHAVRPTPILPP